MSASAFNRDAEAAYLNNDKNLDLVVFNSASADISVFLGNGDGTLQTQRRFDTLPQPAEIEIADVNQDRILDILVPNLRPGVFGSVSILIGRGDGTFLPQRILTTNIEGGAHQLYVADMNGDGLGDLVLIPENVTTAEIRPGLGGGQFGAAIPVRLPAISNAARPVDLNGDGKLDLLLGDFTSGSLFIVPGEGDFTFKDSTRIAVGGTPIQPGAADIVSLQLQPDGSFQLGPADGKIDLVVPLVAAVGQPGAVVLPGVFTQFGGQFITFGPPIPIPSPYLNTEVRFGDFDHDQKTDTVLGGLFGLTVIYGGTPRLVPNVTSETARNLGVVMHHVEATRTITDVTPDAWFRLTVPTEAVSAAGDQVLDFAGFFRGEDAGGLRMEVFDSTHQKLASGDRFRVRSRQGDELLLHVFGVAPDAGQDGRGTGAYSLSIDVLPQLVSVQADSLLPGVAGAPGGPVGSLVLTLQGDRLDPVAASKADAYRVTWYGPDGVANTADDRVIPIGGSDVTQPVVVNPTANVQASSGQTFATSIRQTITLTFADPLPPGAYGIDLSPTIQTSPFNLSEAFGLLADSRFPGHSIVSIVSGQILSGVSREVRDLVRPAGTLGSLAAFEGGTPFLTQLHNDLSIVLDRTLSQFVTNSDITPALLSLIADRLGVALGDIKDRPTSLLVIFLDPVSLDLVDPGNNRVTYNLQSNAVARSIPNAFVEVGGNVEVVVIPNASGAFRLNVANVPDQARGGVVFLGTSNDMVRPFTSELRQGERSFTFDLGTPRTSVPNMGNATVVGSATRSTDETAALAQLIAASTLQAARADSLALAVQTYAASRLPNAAVDGDVSPQGRNLTAVQAAIVNHLLRLVKSAAEQVAPQDAPATEALFQDLLDQLLRLFMVPAPRRNPAASGAPPSEAPATQPNPTNPKAERSEDKPPPAPQPNKNTPPKVTSSRHEDYYPWWRQQDRPTRSRAQPSAANGHRAIWMTQDDVVEERLVTRASQASARTTQQSSKRDAKNSSDTRAGDLEMPFSISDLVAFVFRAE